MQRRLRRMLPLTMAWVMAFSSVGTVAYGAEPDVQIQEEAEGNPGLELQDTAIQEEQQVMPEEIQETGDEEPGQVQDSQQEPGNEPGQETGGAEPDAVSQDQISQDQIFQNEPDIASEENRDALMEGNARQEVRAVEADRSWYKPNETTFTINTAAQLAGLAEIVNGYTDVSGNEIPADSLKGKTVELSGDIDLSAAKMESIGTRYQFFAGTFDGKGHTISGLNLAASGAYTRVALFAYIKEAKIQNLKVSGAVKAENGSSTYCGGIVAYGNNSEILSCTFSGEVTGAAGCTGGVAAYTSGGKIENCENQGKILSASTSTSTYGDIGAGGIVGYASGTEVKECSNKGAVQSGTHYAGGITGYAYSITNITSCENQGEVSYTGTGAVIGYYGGIAGRLGSGQVLYCVNSGSVSAPRYAGGIAGYGSVGSYVKYCVNSGTVTASNMANTAGGIGGYYVNIDSCVTGSGSVYGTNSASYKCGNSYCPGEGESAPAGVTYCTADELTNGAIVAKLNAAGAPVWKQGKNMPEINKASVLGLKVTLSGADRQYEAVFEDGAFTVTVPADADLATITENSFEAEKLSSNVSLTYKKEDNTGGNWKLTVSVGEFSSEYNIVVKCSDKPWTPEISQDLSERAVNYQTGSTEDEVKALSVSANIYDNGKLSYQWYVKEKKEDETGTLVAEAAENTFVPPVKKADGKTNFGNYYYYVVVTNTLTIGNEEKRAAVVSKTAEIHVQYTVQYQDKLEGTNNRTEYVNAGKQPAPRKLTKPGYTFLGWYTGQECREDQKWTENSSIQDDLTLYAGWEAVQYTITLAESTENYTVEAVDPSIKAVGYDGEYSFTVTPKEDGAFMLVKANGIWLEGNENHQYKITDIRENQEITVEYTKGVEPGEDGVYEVSSEAELLSVMEKKPENPVLKLTADISHKGAFLCAKEEEAFQGVLDGQGHTISGLRGPLFGWIAEEGTVKGLKVSGTLDAYDYRVHFGDPVNVGGMEGIGTTDEDFLGSIAAVNRGSIIRCTSDAVLNSQNFPMKSVGGSQVTSVGLGGLVGNNFGSIEFCSFYGKITAPGSWFGGGDAIGGIAAQSDGAVRYCYNKGEIIGDDGMSVTGGGIVGRTNNYFGNEIPTGTVEHCYNVGKVRDQGGSVGGAIVGYTNWSAYSSHEHREAFRECLRNNYFLAGTYGEGNKGFDNQNAASMGLGKTEVMTEDQMKSLDVIKGLNSHSETSAFIKDTVSANGGYPILAWQGSPRANGNTVSIQFSGTAEAKEKLTAEIATELDYSVEWLLMDENGFSVITEKKEVDGEEIDVPYRELTLPLRDAYVGKNLKIRVTDNTDGSSVVSSPQGPVKPASIKKIYFKENLNPDTEMALELAYNNLDPDAQQEGISVNVVTAPEESNALLDGKTISWNSSDETVAAVVPVSSNLIYDHTAETPATARIEARGEGEAEITVSIGEFSAVAKVSVYPVYVTARARISDEEAYKNVTAQGGDLSAIYGEALAGTPRYVTPLHLLTSYIREVQNQDPANAVTIEDGKVTAVNGEEGNWIYIINSKSGGTIDTSSKVEKDGEVTFIKLDPAVEKIASFGESAYQAIRTVDLEVAVQATSISDNTQTPLAGATVIAKKDGVSVNGISAVTDGEGKALLCFQENGEYELTAIHQNPEGNKDIIAPWAKVNVAEKMAVEGIEWVSKDIPQIMEVGDTYQLQAKVKPENANKKGIVYSSDKAEVIHVSPEGLLTAKESGTARITAASEENPEIAVTVSVSAVRSVTEIRLEEKQAVIKAGETCQIKASALPENATNRELEFVSNKTSIASVDNQGVVTGQAPGETTITIRAKDGTGVSAVFTVKVEAAEISVTEISVTEIRLEEKQASIKVGETCQIRASAFPENATNRELEFVSDKANIAAVDSQGVVTGQAPGEAAITIKAKGGTGVSAVFTVKVEAADDGDDGDDKDVEVSKVTLNKTKLTLQIGKAGTLKAAAVPENAVNKTITWSSSNPKVASVDAKGKVKAKKAGTARITAKAANGKRAVCTVTVKKPTIKLNKTVIKIKKGKTNKTVRIKSSSSKTEKIKSARSSKPRVAKVSVKKGKLVIQGKKKGKAVITVTSTNGGTAKVKVTVK